MSDTLSLLGASVMATDNSMTIVGKDELSGGRINASGDHRIAMMAASLAPCCEKDVIIEDAQAVSKSYPAFFKDMEKLGLKSEIIKG